MTLNVENNKYRKIKAEGGSPYRALWLDADDITSGGASNPIIVSYVLHQMIQFLAMDMGMGTKEACQMSPVQAVFDQLHCIMFERNCESVNHEVYRRVSDEAGYIRVAVTAERAVKMVEEGMGR
jgi:hypothetical protein